MLLSAHKYTHPHTTSLKIPLCSLLAHEGERHLLPGALSSHTFCFLLKLLIYLHSKQNLKLRNIKTKHLQERLEPPDMPEKQAVFLSVPQGRTHPCQWEPLGPLRVICDCVCDCACHACQPPTPHFSLSLSPSPPTDNVYLH